MDVNHKISAPTDREDGGNGSPAPPARSDIGRRPPTIADVARLAGVSQATVSYVMNGRNRVGDETKQKVRKAIAALNYQPHSAAQSLASQHVGSIGLVIPHSPDDVFADPFFPELMRGIGRAADRHRNTLVFSMTKGAHVYDQAEAIARSRRADGLIVVDPGEDSSRIVDLVSQGEKVLVIGRQREPGLCYVDVDNEGGAYQAARHLLAFAAPGRRIAIIAGPERQPASNDRLVGYRRGIESMGLDPADALVVHGRFTEESGYECMQGLLKDHEQYLVLAANDLMAIGAMRAVSEAGLAIGRDVKLVGFDDVSYCRFVTPPLTTVRQPVGELGERAAETLITWLKTGRPPEATILPVQLVVRRTCGCTDGAGPQSDN